MKCDYGGYINGKRVKMTRKLWLQTMYILFGISPDKLIAEINRCRKELRKVGYYYPGKYNSWYVPYLYAYFRIEKDWKSYYISPYSNTTSVLHAVKKFLEYRGININRIEVFQNWNTGIYIKNPD